jgi:hypothetical protein
MARYTFRATGGPDEASVTLDPDVKPPHDLPALLALRSTATDLLRNDPPFASATRIDIHYCDDGEPLTSVDRAYLTVAATPVTVGGSA